MVFLKDSNLQTTYFLFNFLEYIKRRAFPIETWQLALFFMDNCQLISLKGCSLYDIRKCDEDGQSATGSMFVSICYQPCILILTNLQNTYWLSSLDKNFIRYQIHSNDQAIQIWVIAIRLRPFLAKTLKCFCFLVSIPGCC